jgi:hypothetical protein
MIFCECLVEGDAVRVLGIGQCAVHVKYDGFDVHGIAATAIWKISLVSSANTNRQHCLGDFRRKAVLVHLRTTVCASPPKR